ncbi:MAG: hypothetical protein D6678_03360 [Zetaproteobacteria bacterium]|nr:MAG: hypothetical protein D6678_03360 [Zetaproteobacteria bacterium]
MHEHYEILGIDPTAKRANIILAYRRAKQTFAEDSLAIYALFSEQERQRMLARIEEAYAALSRASSTL